MVSTHSAVSALYHYCLYRFSVVVLYACCSVVGIRRLLALYFHPAAVFSSCAPLCHTSPPLHQVVVIIIPIRCSALYSQRCCHWYRGVVVTREGTAKAVSALATT